MGRTWPLTGRVEELRFIDAATRRAGGPRGVVLGGAAGVGKTRLARETLAVLSRRGASTRWVAGTASARALPLGAFAALLGAVGEDPTQVLGQATTALLAGAGPAGVVIGVDDAHLLDELSALLVYQLVLRAAATVVVVTVRTGEPAPDDVTALWKDRHLDRLEVQPLSEPETAALLAAVLDGPVDSASVNRMWALTRGNALFLRELVDGELQGSRLQALSGVWRWPGNPVLSQGLTELIEARMGALPDPVLEVVDVLAIAEPLGISLLTRLTDPTAVEQAEDRGLVSVEQDGRRRRARLAHPLYGEVRRARTGHLRSRRLRGDIARALTDTGARRTEDILRRAVLTLESDLEPDPTLLTAAAGRAAQLCDGPLTERLGRAAVAAGGGFRAQMIVASMLIGWCRHQEAEVELATLTRLASTDAELIRVSVPRVINLAWNAARPAEAEAVLDAAESRVGENDARLQLNALRAYLTSQLGQPARAAHSAAMALASPELPDESAVLASVGLVAALATLGRADEIGPAAARGDAAAARSTELGYLRVPLAGMRMLGLRLAGYLHDAAAVALDCHREFKGLVFGGELSNVVLGDAELAQGHLASSLRRLREAHAGMAEHGNAGGFRYACLISLTRAFALSGDINAARRTLTDLQAQQHPTLRFLEPEMVLASAWVSAAEGAVAEAIILAHEAAAVAASRGQLAHEVLALHTAVCFGDGTVADRLTELATQVDGPRAPAAAAHAVALAVADGDALHAASVQLEQMGDLLAAADAAAHSAVAYTHRDRAGPAKAAAARAHQLAQACQDARTPALIATARPLPITGREREIITLAAQGLSNKQIADRLIVSVRTVEGHLYRASTKLGTTHRDQLAALLRGD